MEEPDAPMTEQIRCHEMFAADGKAAGSTANIIGSKVPKIFSDLILGQKGDYRTIGEGLISQSTSKIWPDNSKQPQSPLLPVQEKGCVRAH